MPEEKEEKKEEELEVPLKVQEPKPIEVPRRAKVRTSNLEDDIDLIKTVSSIPSDTPKSSLERIKVYVSGTTYRLYVWDGENNTWRYVSLT